MITGCTHPGIISIVRKAQAVSPKADIALVMGGFHLLSASRTQIDEIVRASVNSAFSALLHLTASAISHAALQNGVTNYVDGGAGLILKLSARQETDKSER